MAALLYGIMHGAALRNLALQDWDTIIDSLAAEITTRHYSRKTLKAYADWSRKFQGFLHNKPPGELSAVEVKSYLTHLAVTCHVAASTQNQAFNALLFLYRHVLKKDFGDHKDIPRAKKSKYIPVVLSRQEIDAVLKHLVLPMTWGQAAVWLRPSFLRMPETAVEEFQFRRRNPHASWKGQDRTGLFLFHRRSLRN